MDKIIIGSRGSDLALWQARYTQDLLTDIGVTSEIKIIETQGDKIQHLSFDKMEGKGFFTKEIEEALLNESIDLAVHSHKDLETSNPEGLTIAGVSYRENPSDVLLIHERAFDADQPFQLKQNAVVGTSSARRKAMMKSLRNDISLKDLRGNVPTRVNKLREGQYDAILLANAGLSRLELDTKGIHVQVLKPTEFIPAPSQGVLGWQIRQKDTKLHEIISQIHNTAVHNCISIERGILKKLNGGCQMPLGAYTIKNGDEFETHVGYAKTATDPVMKFVLKGSSIEELIDEAVEKINHETVS